MTTLLVALASVLQVAASNTSYQHFAEIYKDLCLRDNQQMLNVTGLCAHNLGIARCDMPQMPDSAFVLNGSSFFAANITERDIEASITDGNDVDQFVATQDQLNYEHVDAMLATVYSGKWHGDIWGRSESMIQVAEDGYILDGHHRWATIYALQRNATFMRAQGLAPGDPLPLSVMRYSSTLAKQHPEHPPRPTTVANMIAIANRGPVGHKCECYEASPHWYPCNSDV